MYKLLVSRGQATHNVSALIFLREGGSKTMSKMSRTSKKSRQSARKLSVLPKFTCFLQTEFKSKVHKSIFCCCLCPDLRPPQALRHDHLRQQRHRGDPPVQAPRLPVLLLPLLPPVPRGVHCALCIGVCNVH